MRDGRVTFVNSQQCRREHNRMEGHVILSNELNQIDFDVLILRLPPLLPLAGVFVCYGHVSDGSVEPNVKHFTLKSFVWYRNAPFQISSNATRF